MPYRETPWGYRELYEIIKGVAVSGTTIDLNRNIGWSENNYDALDKAESIVLSLPKDWLQNIQAVLVQYDLKNRNYMLAVANNMPKPEPLIEFIQSEDWNFIANAPAKPTSSITATAFGKLISKSTSILFFDTEGFGGREFPFDISEVEKQIEEEIYAR